MFFKFDFREGTNYKKAAQVLTCPSSNSLKDLPKVFSEIRLEFKSFH